MQNNQFSEMGKEALRAACREAGISYGKLNNDGMREALRRTKVEFSKETQNHAYHPAEFKLPEGDEFKPKSTPGAFSALLNPVAPAPVVSAIRVVDGKKADAKAKADATGRTAAERAPAPVVPRATRKGYTIEKGRPEQNGVKRPSAGTVCGAVWDAFDANPNIKASELNALADANTWNRTNVSCEFYNWRKFNGIKGRS